MSTQNADVAADALGEFFPGVSIGAGPEHGFAYSLDVWSSATGLSYFDEYVGGRHVHARAPEMGGHTIGTTNLEGRFLDGRDEIDHADPFTFPPGIVVDLDRMRARMLSIDDTAIEAHLRTRPGMTVGGPFRFTGRSARTAALAETWAATAAYVDSAMRSDIIDQPVFAAALTETIIAAAIACFPNNWNTREPAENAAGLTATVRRAKTFIDEHAHEPLMVADIATAARLSPRGLQLAFSRQLGITPMRYLRRVRLEHARTALTTGDPTTTSIGLVADRFGFRNLSRFAADYRGAFGENPSETLRR